MMPSAASASIAALQPRRAATPLTPEVPQAPAVPSINVPAKPDLPVVNQETASQEAWIAAQLDPKHAAFIGNKYKPLITDAGATLKEGIAGFGGYDFNVGEMGELTNPRERQGTGESLGENYRTETLRQLAAANARGMQSSRMADEAVGLAWSRLNQQKRDFFTRYATTVSGALNQMQSESSGLTTNLLDLYGQDVQYAIENPILGQETTGGGATGGGEAATSPGAPKAPTKPKSRILWHGKRRPTQGALGVIANRNYLPGQTREQAYARPPLSMAQVQAKRRGGGKGYVVVRK